MKKVNPGKFFLTWNLLFYFTLYNLIDDYSAIPAMGRRERKLREIIKVVIKHCSGYCAFDDAYNEKLTMTPDSISYEYVPINITETNPVKNGTIEQVIQTILLLIRRLQKWSMILFRQKLKSAALMLGKYSLLLCIQTKQ